VLTAPRGERGFGYDPVFLPDDGGGLGSAELEPALKNRISHRGQALAALRELLFPSPFGRGGRRPGAQRFPKGG
jgi:XTP/dITP diphosphohydrolase